MSILTSKNVNLGNMAADYGKLRILRRTGGDILFQLGFFFALPRSGDRFSIVVLSVHLLPAFVGAILATHGVDTVAMNGHTSDRTHFRPHF